MVSEYDIESVIAELKSQIKPNVSATAKKWGLEYTTLAKCFSGQTTSRATYLSE